jgi:hypothetical protein
MVLHPKIIRILKEPLGELILNDDIKKKLGITLEMLECWQRWGTLQLPSYYHMV